jgi:hypothetical protein
MTHAGGVALNYAEHPISTHCERRTGKPPQKDQPAKVHPLDESDPPTTVPPKAMAPPINNSRTEVHNGMRAC